MSAPAPLPGKIQSVEFHRTKYGRELLIDVIRAAEIPTFEMQGAPHVLSFYEIFLITRGEGMLTLDGREYRVRPGQVFFTGPGQPRRWRTRGLDGLCLFFTSDFIEDFFRDPLFLFTLPYFHREDARLCLALDPAEAGTLAVGLSSMRREIRKLRSDSSHALRAALYWTLVQLARRYTETTGGPVRENATAVRLRRLIERHFRECHQPKDYAAKLRITVGHLNHLAKRHLGRTAGVVIRERLTLEAKRQLAHSGRSAAEVAYDLGFKDPAYFARFMRRETGKPPSRLRVRESEMAGRLTRARVRKPALNARKKRSTARKD